MITMVDYAFPRLNGGARLNRLSRGNDGDNGEGRRVRRRFFKKSVAATKRLETACAIKAAINAALRVIEGGGGANYRGGFDKSSRFERKFSIVPGTDGWKGIRDADTKEVYFSFSIGSCNLNDN